MALEAFPRLSLNYLDTPDKFPEFWSWLTSHDDFVAADTETTSLRWWEPNFGIRLFQFGDCDTGWAIPFNEWRGAISGALRWLSSRRVKTVWHNLAFDSQALQSEGITLDMSAQQDTFVWASLIGFAEDSRGLKSISAREFGGWAQFGQEVLKRGMSNAGWTWATVPFSYYPYTAYGAIDTILGARYYSKYKHLMEPYEWHHSLEIASIEATGMMARNGLAVNTNYAAEKLEELEAKEAVIMARLNESGVTSAFHSVSAEKVLRDAGLIPEDAKKTDKGAVSIDKAFLESVKSHPVAHDILMARKIHRTGTYFKSMLREADGVLSDRILIHPDIRSMEARTGRMSIADPALQQLPTPDEDDPDTRLVRAAVVARSDDHKLIGADFGQIELRMFASLTGDQNLIDVLNATDEAKARGDHANADFFVAMGRDVYHQPDFKKSDPKRRLLKATTYATMYSGGEETIANTAGVPQSEIHEVLVAMQERYSSFRTLGAELLSDGGTGPYGEPVTVATTPTGRRFAVAHRSERRKLLNYLIQGHSAEVLKMAIQNTREAGLEDYLMLPVHDELILSVPAEMAERHTATLLECMNAVVDKELYGVAVQAAAASPADNWADLDH